MEAKKASEHSEALKSARLELNNVKERNHLENAEREAEMAGLAKELECVRENREVVMAEKAALETRLRASERKVLALEAEQQELLRRAQEMEEGLQQAVGRSRDLAETLDKARREKEAETLYGFEPLREALAEASEARDKALARCASLAEAVSKAKQEAVKAANERDALASEVKRLRTQEKSSMHSLSKQTPSPAKQHPDRYMLSVSPSRGSDSPVDGLRSGKNGGAVAWKTNWMPEALPVDMGGDAAGRLAHAAADITSALANELGALRASALPGTALIEGQGAQQVASVRLPASLPCLHPGLHGFPSSSTLLRLPPAHPSQPHCASRPQVVMVWGGLFGFFPWGSIFHPPFTPRTHVWPGPLAFQNHLHPVMSTWLPLGGQLLMAVYIPFTCFATYFPATVSCIPSALSFLPSA